MAASLPEVNTCMTEAVTGRLLLQCVVLDPLEVKVLISGTPCKRDIHVVRSAIFYRSK